MELFARIKEPLIKYQSIVVLNQWFPRVIRVSVKRQQRMGKSLVDYLTFTLAAIMGKLVNEHP